MKEWKNRIYYSQCWEDPKILLEALQIAPNDRILSITSGGCNTLALALESPKSIVALDINSAQNHLLELKILAIKSFNYDDFLKFVGVSKCNDRAVLFEKIKPLLRPEVQEWWNTRMSLIRMGIIHVGRFEKYLNLFRNWLLPVIHSRESLKKLSLAKNLSEQNDYYKATWDNWRWRVLFKIFFSKFVMSRLGRNPVLFTYAGKRNIGDHYLQKTKYALTEIPIKDNFFLEYILFGTYRTQELMPPYLRKENFDLLKKKVDLINITTEDIKDYLTKSPDNSFSKFNLSNIFEVQPAQAADMIFAELARVSTNGGRLAYWNNLVQRKFPNNLTHIQEETKLSKELEDRDRVFFYQQFHVNTIRK